MRLNAFLVEDLPIVRHTLVEAMEELAPLRFVGHAATETGARQWLDSHPGQWDLAIVDLFLAEGTGLGVLQDCQVRQPWQKVVVLTNYMQHDLNQQCLQLGADEVFDKSGDVEQLAIFCRAHALQRTLGTPA